MWNKNVQKQLKCENFIERIVIQGLEHVQEMTERTISLFSTPPYISPRLKP